MLADIVVGRLFHFDPADAAGRGLATLRELQLFENGAPIDLYSTYYPRADTRLAQLPNNELWLLSKARGEVFALGSVDVPEPASMALLLTALTGYAALRSKSAAMRRN